MTRKAVADFFPRGFPVKVSDVEVRNGPMIPTYQLMKQLAATHPGNRFYCVLGSDLLPGLKDWGPGQAMIEELDYVIVERAGYEHILDPEVEKTFQLPLSMEVIPASENVIGSISSTLVRSRIKDAR